MRLTRRLFTQGAVLAPLPLLIAAAPSKKESLKFDYFKRHEDGSFEKIRKTPKEKRNLVPIRDYLPAPLDEVLTNAALQQLYPALLRKGVAPGSRVQIDIIQPVRSRYFAIAEDSTYSAQAISYGNLAKDFILSQSEFRKLDKPDIEWTVPGAKVRAKIPAYVVLCYTEETEVKFDVRSGEFNSTEIVDVSQFISNSAEVIFHPLFLEIGKVPVFNPLEQALIVVPTTADPILLLLAPLSEFIHLMLMPRINEYFKKKWQKPLEREEDRKLIIDEYELLSETIAESISLHLTGKLLGKDVLKEAQAVIPRKLLEEKTFKGLETPPYRLLKNAHTYLQRNGLKNTLDLFMKKPDEYLEAIKEA